MSAKVATGKQLLHSRKQQMDVLWGAWAEYVRLPSDIIGIYDNIQKNKREDFPFTIDLLAVIAYEAQKAECDRKFLITLEILDLDAVIRLSSIEQEITVPGGDSPIRWYQDYYFDGVEIERPGYYELDILIGGQFKQRIPLWVTAPKMIIENPEKDSFTELWPEDFNLRDKGKNDIDK